MNTGIQVFVLRPVSLGLLRPGEKVRKTGTTSLDSVCTIPKADDAQQISSNNRKQIQPLWINYMWNLDPLIGCGQSWHMHCASEGQKANNVSMPRFFWTLIFLCLLTHPDQQAQDGYCQFWSERISAVTSGLECGGGAFFFFLLPVSNFQAAPVTSSLDFHSFLLSPFAFFLILVLRFIRGNTCPPKDGLHAVTD